MFGGMAFGEFFCSLERLFEKCRQHGVQYQYEFIYSDSLITRARNDLVHSFLKSDATHLLFIDADIVFNEDAVFRMLSENKSFLCGLYPKKHINWDQVYAAAQQNTPAEYLKIAASEYVFNPVDKNCTITSDEQNLISVQNAGTGFMLLTKDVFSKLKPCVPSYKGVFANEGETVYDFFGLGICPNTNELLSEDYNFCRLWRQLGEEIFIAPWALCKHVGRYVHG